MYKKPFSIQPQWKVSTGVEDLEGGASTGIAGSESVLSRVPESKKGLQGSGPDVGSRPALDPCLGREVEEVVVLWQFSIPI